MCPQRNEVCGVIAVQTILKSQIIYEPATFLRARGCSSSAWSFYVSFKSDRPDQKKKKKNPAALSLPPADWKFLLKMQEIVPFSILLTFSGHVS